MKFNFNRFIKKLSKKNIEDSIYIKTLELGFDANEIGVSFDEVVKKLNIDLSNEHFEITFAVWFYSNFYNSKIESKVLGLNTASNPSYYFNQHTFKELKQYNCNKSFIKGDALNKYVDFLELKRTRESSRKATYLAYASLFVALSSIITPIIFPHYFQPKYNKIESKQRHESEQCKNSNSFKTESRTEDVNDSQTNATTKLDSIN